MLILICLCAMISVSSLAYYVGKHRISSDPSQRLVRYQERNLDNLSDNAEARSFAIKEPVTRSRPFEEYVKEIAAWVSGKFSSSYLAEIEKLLIMAGLQHKMRPAQFVVIRVTLTCLVPCVYGLLMQKSFSLLNLVAFTALAWVLPDFWLKRQVSARQALIIKALPDTIDLLTVSVEAGLAFDAASAKVTERGQGPLQDEFHHYLRLIRMGTPRRAAMKELGERSGVPDLHAFATGMIQADQLGVSMSNVLRVQSDELRRKRRQRAEEKAMKAPIKMLFPLILFIFPSIFIVLLGPAGINVLDAFAAL
jgi:tight adherence protein C